MKKGEKERGKGERGYYFSQKVHKRVTVPVRKSIVGPLRGASPQKRVGFSAPPAPPPPDCKLSAANNLTVFSSVANISDNLKPEINLIWKIGIRLP